MGKLAQWGKYVTYHLLQFQNNLNKQMQPETSFSYSTVSCFKQRPSQNVRYLISRQLPKLIDIAITESLEFVNTNQTKGKALKQLKYTVLIAEERIAPFLEKIIKALVKIWQLDIENIQKNIKDVMSIIGYHVKSNFYLPLMMSLLTEEEFKNSTKNTIILLRLISYMLQTSEDLESHLQQIIKLISAYENLLIENDEGLSTVCQIAMTITKRLNSLEYNSLISTLFSVLLNVQSTKSIPRQFRQAAKQSMKLLAKKSGFSSVAQLHSQQVGPVLARIIQKKQYTSWHKTSKDRFKFDTIVRNCEGEAIRYLGQILTVLEFCISVSCEVEIRMDTLVLLEAMIDNEQVRQALKEHAVRIYLKILNVAIKWKVGLPQIKVRKAGLINMIKMIELEVINQDQLLQCLSQILPNIKQCLSDDWGPEERLTACDFLQKFLFATKQKIDGEKLKDLYVILLQRLDDSQDKVREKITKAINIFLTARQLPITNSVSSILEYMISAIFIHYDDSQQQIRDCINTSLRFAAQVDPNKVLMNAKVYREKMKHPEQCQQLIQFCQGIIESRKL